MKLFVLLLIAGGLMAQNPNTANFPGSAISLPVASSQAQSTLNGGVSSGATSLTLTDSTGFRVPGIFAVEGERFWCTTNVANVLGSCTPGFDGTSQAAHSSGKTVSAYVSSWMLNQIAAEVAAIGARAASAITKQMVFNDQAPVIDDDGLFTILNPASAIHITRVSCGVTGTTSVVMNLVKGTYSLISDLTATAGDLNTVSTTAFANGSAQCGGTASCAVAAHTPVTLHVGTIVGTPTNLACAVDYVVD